MLTKRPDVVIAVPPKRSRRRKAQAMLILTSRIVDHNKLPAMSEEDVAKRGDAVDRLFQDLVRRTRDAPEQPSKPRRPAR